MILGPVSYLDCIVFVTFLAPQLLIHVGLFHTLLVVLRCLPFLLLELPWSFVSERYLAATYKKGQQSAFVQKASPFEDFVIRCVRYAFANIPPNVGRVFFSRAVALPFLRFRLLRHGYLRCPVHYREYTDVVRKRFKGVWIVKDPTHKPDTCILYAHGGGFSMGSSYFYLEYLLTWHSLLADSGYRNPAIFALEYTLVPDQCFPMQLQETIAAYEHVLSMTRNPDRVVVSGDSAGATLILSLLLHLGNLSRHAEKMDGVGSWRLAKPGLGLIISPWVTLVSNKHRNTRSDYLDARNLHMYAEQYAGNKVAIDDPLLSPGSCRDVSWWKTSMPSQGLHVAYGSEEVFASDIADFVGFLEGNKLAVSHRQEMGGIHAWPVACLFLSNSPQDRLKGLKDLVEKIRVTI